MFWRPSPLVAADPSRSASRCLAIPSYGITTSARCGQRHPEPAHVGVLAAHQSPDRLGADVGGQDEELDRDELLRAGSSASEKTRWPVKRQTMIAAGEALDRRVEPEADQRDRAGEHAREDRDAALERHVGEARATTAGAPARRAGDAQVGEPRRRVPPAVRAATRLFMRAQATRAGPPKQRAPRLGERVHDHLALASGGSTSPAARRARAWCETSLSERSQTQARSQTHSSPSRPTPPPESAASDPRAPSRARPAAAQRRHRGVRPRSRSAFGRSRHRRSQRSSATAPPYQHLDGY